MKSSCARLVSVVACFLFALPGAAQAPEREDRAAPAVFGGLQPGPYAVGFRVLTLRDESRPVRAKKDYFGNADTTDRARLIAVHVWYPAVASNGSQMTIADAMDSTEGVTTREASRNGKRAFIEQSFGEVDNQTWQRFLAMPLLARKEADPAPGKFPLLLGQLRPFSTELTNEYLASHGYVVAMTHGPRAPMWLPAAAGLEVATRDMELAWVRLKNESFVDGSKLALLGFSGAGFSQVLLAMRNPDVDALVDLESALFSNRIRWSLPQGLGYDPHALRAPFMHTYSVPLSKLDDNFGEFEKYRYSHRFHYLVDAPQIHHWDFATEGMAASTVLGLRPKAAPLLRRAFEMTNLYVLNFLNAFVQGDPAGLQFLRRDPVVNGAPARMLTITEKPGVRPAPTANELVHLLERHGTELALRAFRESRAADPQASLFEENSVKRIAYDLLGQRRVREAIEFFRFNAETYPNSPDAHDSLAEAYEAGGEMELARKSAQAALVALDTNKDLPDALRKELREIQEKRLARLKAKQ
jgi:tetratricopeptide (TPR) repeat protein